MDNLFRQTRLRFSGVGREKKEETKSGEDLKIPPQKTVTFKDKKKDPNWLQRRLSMQMNPDHDSSNIDEQVVAVAVAVAAYAISSLNGQGIPDQKKTKDELKTSTVIIKGKKEDTTISIPEHGRVSKRVSGEITEVVENPDTKVPKTAASDTKKPEKALLPAPSFRKTSSPFDKQLSGSLKRSNSSFKPGSEAPKPELPTSAVKPARAQSFVDRQPSVSFKLGSSTTKPNVPAGTIRQSSTRAGAGKTQADIWEETELARITETYEVQQNNIVSWEDKKKKKAKRQLDKTEGELERKRAKALQKFRRRIQNIDSVVGGAKAKAEEKKKNDELKVKEKANTIKRTGKVPSTCSCF